MKILSLMLVGTFLFGLAAPICLSQEDTSKKILKEGLLGAATGAVAAGASGGKAGKGALIGAGVSVVGGALLDTITAPASTPAPQQVQTVPVEQAPSLYQQGYDAGYQKGFEVGYEKGYQAGIGAKR